MLTALIVIFMVLLLYIVIDAFSFDTWHQRILHMMVWFPAWALAFYYTLLSFFRLEAKIWKKVPGTSRKKKSKK